MWKVQNPTDGNFVLPDSASQIQKRGPHVVKWIERALLASGLALLAVYSAARFESLLISRAALKEFAARKASAAPARQNAREETTSRQQTISREIDSRHEAEPPDVDFSLGGQHRVVAYKRSLPPRLDASLGVLSIPKIHLEVPLLDGTDDLTLNHAVGRILGTAHPGERGNIGIAGHRDGFFRGLKDVVVGDAIHLKTLQGTDSYVVDRIQIVSPSDVEVLQPRSAPSLTLVTCYPFYFVGSAPQRYIVTASLRRETTSGPEISKSVPLIQISSSIRRNK
jgi:sortase A